jgi:hypothetical protein
MDIVMILSASIASTDSTTATKAKKILSGDYKNSYDSRKKFSSRRKRDS